MSGRQRAIRDEQKQQRRQAILDVAWERFQETSYQAITMAEVAERAGLAKGTIYLYFKTKEELFLSVQEQQLQHWFDEVDARLAAQELRGAAAVAQLICETLDRRPGLTRLLAILHSVLEQNVDFATALRFKRMLLARMTSTGSLLEQALPFLAAGQGAQLLLRIHALVIGLQHLADPPPLIRRTLNEPGMQIFEIDFAATFSDTLIALLRGLDHGPPSE